MFGTRVNVEPKLRRVHFIEADADFEGLAPHEFVSHPSEATGLHGPELLRVLIHLLDEESMGRLVLFLF